MIHKFKMFDTNIVVDVYSGAVHCFDDIAFDILDFYEGSDRSSIAEKLSGKYDRTAIMEAIDEIDRLAKEGQLFAEDTYSQYLSAVKQEPVVKALCLHISHDCNLRCRYCFASTGDFGVGRSMMSPDTGKKAIDFVIAASGKRRNIEIDFFGGEPLMNFEAVREVVDYARNREKETNKNFRFTLTTNAVLLNDEHTEYINRHMHNIVLSLDGRQETNDRMRCRVDGTGTYRDILPKIKKMAEARKQDNYYVRGTFTRENLDFSKDVLHLADQGFRQVSVEPVVAAANTDFDIREEDLPVLFEEYEKLAYEYVDRKKKGNAFNFFHFMIDLSQGPCAVKRLKGCGSGHEYLAVTPEGDIYPCHQFAGMEEFKMGNVYSEQFETKLQNRFAGSNIYQKEKCRSCWAKFYCSGGCAANAWQFNKDINIPYNIGCELEKKRMECALWIKTQEME